MPHPELPCPECDGAGFYGGNGPVVETLCAFCHGTGVHEPAEDITARPPDRAYVSVYSDPKHSEAVDKIASEMRERLERYGS